MHHVNADRVALRKNPFELIGLRLGVGGVVRDAPAIEPSIPPLGGHERTVGTQLVQRCKSLGRVAGRKIDSAMNPGSDPLGIKSGPSAV